MEIIQKNDVKITFVEKVNNEQKVDKIRVFLKDTLENYIQIDLRQGDVVYSQTEYMSNSLRIYQKKGFIDIEYSKKPEYLNYYTGYSFSDVENKRILWQIDKNNFTNNILPENHEVNDLQENDAVEDFLISGGDELEKDTNTIDLVNDNNTETKKETEEVLKDAENNAQSVANKAEKDKIENDTIVGKAIKEVKKYFNKKKKPKSKRGPGRPKKRGPKKGSKRKKPE